MLNYRPVFDNGLLKIFDPSSMQNSFSCEMFECFLTCTASFKSHNISMGFFLGFFFNKNCFFFSNNVLVELLVQDNPAERSTSSSPFRQITIYYLSALWYDAEFMAESLTPSCARKTTPKHDISTQVIWVSSPQKPPLVWSKHVNFCCGQTTTFDLSVQWTLFQKPWSLPLLYFSHWQTVLCTIKHCEAKLV